MRHTFIAIASSAALLGACAQSPDAIAPVSMPAGMYDQTSCAAARAERNAVAEQLATAEARQRSAVTGDAIGVLLIGVPMASLSGGDNAAVIATERGRLNALDARLLRC
jgi:hypothetical protein